MIRTELMIAAAREAIGTPFRHQGRTVGKGIDCAGLMVYAMSSAGLDVMDTPTYSRRAGGSMLEAALDSQPALIRVHGIPQAGDILLMRFDGDPCHLAICTGPTMIHAWAIVRKVCEHDFNREWQSRVVRIYRVNENG